MRTVGCSRRVVRVIDLSNLAELASISSHGACYIHFSMSDAFLHRGLSCMALHGTNLCFDKCIYCSLLELSQASLD